MVEVPKNCGAPNASRPNWASTMMGSNGRVELAHRNSTKRLSETRCLLRILVEHDADHCEEEPGGGMNGGSLIVSDEPLLERSITPGAQRVGGDPEFSRHPFQGTLAADQKVDGFLPEADVVVRMGLGNDGRPFWILCALPVH